MKNLKKNWIIVILIITSCSKSNPPYGKLMNSERKITGIPIIKDNWIFVEPVPGLFDWHEKNVNVYRYEEPQHVGKIVMVNDSLRLSEEDIFFNRINDSLFHFVSITHLFNRIENPWLGELRIDSLKKEIINGELTDVMRTKNSHISFQEAIEILESWGIKYPH